MAAYVTCRRVHRRAPRALTGLAALVPLGLALFGLAACGKVGMGGGSDEMSWARAALERNDRIEIVATDPATHTFTIRIKDTGDLRTVRADQVVAAPPGVTAAATGAAGGAAASPSPSAADSATASNTEPSGSETALSAAPGAAAASPNSGPAMAANSTPSGAPASAVNDTAANSPAQALPPAASVARTGYQPSTAPVAEAPNPNSDVASITPGGRVLESGPGYAIKTASGKSAPQVTAVVERTTTTTSAIERRHDPIICQGQRLLHIDNRNIAFDEDAVAAEDGCEIYITNSHIIAKGVGVSARRALVHIDNSQIEGDTASIDASEGAQVYVQSSTFKGVSRRLDNSSFHDMGGNVWN